jgi:hypothetical protein
MASLVIGAGVCAADDRYHLGLALRADGFQAGQQFSHYLYPRAGGVHCARGLLHHGDGRCHCADLAHEACRCRDALLCADWCGDDVYRAGYRRDLWVWDVRITSMLVLFFLYLGVIALAEAYNNRDSGTRAASVLALVGTVNIPIIYKSVDWWYSLHQPATIKLTQKPSMHPDMWWPLLVMIVGFYVFYAVLLLLYTRSEILQREHKTKWVRELVLAQHTAA